MSDCIPNSKLNFCHAEIDRHGYIYIESKMFHRDMTFDEFNPKTIFYSLEEAVDELPNYDGNSFVMAFPENDVPERMWFMPQQKENGVTKRLNVFKGCYGEYKHSIYKGVKNNNA